MRKYISLFLCLLFTQFFVAQKYATKAGTLQFEASVSSFEEVKASNENVSALLNAETGAFACLALIKGFRFKVALMEEHFNENYAESYKFPKATFKGKIEGFALSDLSETQKTYSAVGIINFHGIDKNVIVPLSIKMIEGVLYIDTKFVLKPEDFEIKIPGIVSNKIAEEVNVSGSYSLKK